MRQTIKLPDGKVVVVEREGPPPCATCVKWARDQHDPSKGICRAPLPHLQASVAADHWCAEHSLWFRFLGEVYYPVAHSLPLYPSTESTKP